MSTIAVEALTKRYGHRARSLGRLRRCFDHVHAFGGEHRVEDGREFGVAVGVCGAACAGSAARTAVRWVRWPYAPVYG